MPRHFLFKTQALTELVKFYTKRLILAFSHTETVSMSRLFMRESVHVTPEMLQSQHYHAKKKTFPSRTQRGYISRTKDVLSLAQTHAGPGQTSCLYTVKYCPFCVFSHSRALFFTSLFHSHSHRYPTRGLLTRRSFSFKAWLDEAMHDHKPTVKQTNSYFALQRCFKIQVVITISERMQFILYASYFCLHTGAFSRTKKKLHGSLGIRSRLSEHCSQCLYQHRIVICQNERKKKIE